MVTYTGSPRGVLILAQMPEVEHLEVSYEQPIERRGAGGEDVVTLVISVVSSLGANALYDAAKSAAGRFLEQFPKATVTVEEPEDDDE